MTKIRCRASDKVRDFKRMISQKLKETFLFSTQVEIIDKNGTKFSRTKNVYKSTDIFDPPYFVTGNVRDADYSDVMEYLNKLFYVTRVSVNPTKHYGNRIVAFFYNPNEEIPDSDNKPEEVHEIKEQPAKNLDTLKLTDVIETLGDPSQGGLLV